MTSFGWPKSVYRTWSKVTFQSQECRTYDEWPFGLGKTCQITKVHIAAP